MFGVTWRGSEWPGFACFLPYALWKQGVFPEMSWRGNPSPSDSDSPLLLEPASLSPGEDPGLAPAGSSVQGLWGRGGMGRPAELQPITPNLQACWRPSGRKGDRPLSAVQTPRREGHLSSLAQHPNDKGGHGRCLVTAVDEIRQLSGRLLFTDVGTFSSWLKTPASRWPLGYEPLLVEY